MVREMALYDISFYFALFFLSGVLAASWDFGLATLVFILATAAGFIFYKRKSVMVKIIWLLPAALLGYGYFFFFNNQIAVENIIYDKKIGFYGVVSDLPVAGVKNQNLTVNLEKPLSGEVTISAGLVPVYDYGDQLKIFGMITKNNRRNISNYPKITLVEKNHGSKIKNILFSIRRSFTGKLDAVLPSEEAALLAGLTVGDRSQFSQGLKNAMSQSGTSHIAALSGYNISVIVIAVFFLLGKFLSRQKSFYIMLAVISLFVLMTGAEASVVRAAIMGLMMLLAERASRLYSAKNAIAVTALVMVLFDPNLLAFNVGFELSFLALLGIIYVAPALKKIFRVARSDSGFLNWKENGLATLSAQLAVLPILLAYFHQFNLLSIISNILILETVPLAMALGFFTGILGFVSYQVSLAAALLTGLFLKYQIFVINFFAQVTMPLRLDSPPLFMGVIYYGALAALIFYGHSLREPVAEPISKISPPAI